MRWNNITDQVGCSRNASDLVCIGKMYGSNLGRDTDYPGSEWYRFSSGPNNKMPTRTSSEDTAVSFAFSQLSIHELPYHSALCILSYWEREAGIATGYGLDHWGVGVRVPVESRIFSSSHRPDRLSGPLNYLSKGYRGLFPRGVKQPGREADHSPPAGDEVKKMWIYTSTHPYDFMA
jgi:hypothetical protein